EADDIIASYAVAAQKAGKSVVIASSDKDLMQLVGATTDGGPAIQVYDTMKQRLIDPAAVEAKFGVAPARLGDLLALMGDSSDNIPGVKGIGQKTAAQLLADFGDLEGVLAAAPTIKQAKRREALVEHAEDARISRQLVALRCDVELPRPLEALKDPGADGEAMVAFFGPLGFRSLVGGAAVSKSATTAVAGKAGGSGAQGLQAAAALTIDASQFRTILAADEAELAALCERLLGAEALAIQITVDHPDAML